MTTEITQADRFRTAFATRQRQNDCIGSCCVFPVGSGCQCFSMALEGYRQAAHDAAVEAMERACLAAQYSPHPYSDLKQALRSLKTSTTNTTGD